MSAAPEGSLLPIRQRAFPALLKVFLSFQIIAATYGLREMGVGFLLAFPLAILGGWIPVIGTGAAIYGAVKSWDFPLWAAAGLFIIPSLVLIKGACIHKGEWGRIREKITPKPGDTVVDRIMSVPTFMALEIGLLSIFWVIASFPLRDILPQAWLGVAGKEAPAMALESYHTDDEEVNRYSVRVKFKTADGKKIDTYVYGPGAPPGNTRDVLKEEPSDPDDRPVPLHVRYSPRNPYFCVIPDSEKFGIGRVLSIVALLGFLGTIVTVGILRANISEETKQRWKYSRTWKASLLSEGDRGAGRYGF